MAWSSEERCPYEYFASCKALSKLRRLCLITLESKPWCSPSVFKWPTATQEGTADLIKTLPVGGVDALQCSPSSTRPASCKAHSFESAPLRPMIDCNASRNQHFFPQTLRASVRDRLCGMEGGSSSCTLQITGARKCSENTEGRLIMHRSH